MMTMAIDHSSINIEEITIISRDQIEDGTPNDIPLTAFSVRLPGGETGWIAGWHGVSCCAIGDWLEWMGTLAATREDAIEQHHAAAIGN